MTVYYTYLLRCGDGSYYAGITTDPARRLAEHRAGGKKGARYTRARAPLAMVALWESPDRSRASRLEQLLKHASHQVKDRLSREPEALGELLPLGEGETFPVSPLPDQAETARREDARK